MGEVDSGVSPSPAAAQAQDVAVGKTAVATGSGEAAEVFTMAIGGETITLLPHRNWSQLDVYKWRARGKIPGTPAGLEITTDHVKVAGQSVSTRDPQGAARLQKVLNEWLAFERGNLTLAQRRAPTKGLTREQETAGQAEGLRPRFRVEVDQEGQVHIKCLKGRETLAMIGLNLPGFHSLVNQGLMHKPHAMKVGALHDWVELDGEFFSFEKGTNDAAKLETALNERYACAAEIGQGKEVVILPNAASSTGFDIQFAARVGGALDRRRRPLNDESLALLQDRDKCGLLPRELVIKLSPPNLIFKLKTPDGGERYLEEGPEQVVTITGEEGEVKLVDLSRPVNYLRLTALELTAVFNHPAINQHSRASGSSASASPASQTGPPVPPTVAAEPPAPVPVAPPPPPPRPPDPPKPQPESSPLPERRTFVAPKRGGDLPTPLDLVIRPLPNLWLEAVLRRPVLGEEWVTCLLYRIMAEHFGNSAEGYFGPIPCWACSLGEVEDICDPGFRGLFLTKKGWLGYLSQSHLTRFHHEVAFLGTIESAIEGIGVSLLATGRDARGRIVFIVAENYRAQFGVPAEVVAAELTRLRQHGALVMSVPEVLQSPDAMELVWMVPAEQQDPADPQAVEIPRPGVPPAAPPPPEGT